MKISLQIILADARSPGRGLPPQPFDRHISGELPNLDNIIQESESQYGDSARADTIQLPRAAGADSARWRVPTQGPGTAPSAQGLGFEVPPLRVGEPAEIPSSGSDSGSQLVPPQPRRPAWLLAAKFPFLRCVNSPQGRVPLKPAFQSSRPGPHRAGMGEPLAEESPSLESSSKAARRSAKGAS